MIEALIGLALGAAPFRAMPVGPRCDRFAAQPLRVFGQARIAIAGEPQ